MDKRGQFYLIAAVLIVIVISSLVVVANYASSSPTPQAIDSLSNSLENEGPRIADYGIYTKNDINQLLTNFTSNDFAPYFLSQTENSSVVFIYGNQTNLYGVQYNLSSKGTVSATVGGLTTWQTSGVYSQNINVVPSGNSVNVTILGKSFPFQLRNNTMFYFVIIEQKNNETYIKKNN